MERRVKGEGSRNARMVLVGESPGEAEERAGRPFVGPAGSVLDQLLADNGLRREDCWIDNVMEVRPPGNDFGFFYEDRQRHNPKPDLLLGWERLHRTVMEINPDIVVCLGAEPLRALTGKRGIDLHRGFPFRLNDTNLIATYHPAYILREWKGYPTAKMDFGRAKDIMTTYKKTSPTPDYHLNYQPSFGQCIEYLDSVLSNPKEPLALDVEFANYMIDCIGFCQKPGETITIPFAQDAGDGNYWSEGQELLLWKKIAEVLQSDVPKIGQNIPYEMFQLQTTRGIRINNIWLDTMVAFNLMYPGQTKSLDYLATVYTYLPWWGEAPKVLGPERWKYNSMDCLVTKAISQPIVEDLERTRLKDFYYKIPHKLLEPLHKMSVRGVRVDRDWRTATRARYRKRITNLRRWITKSIPQEDIVSAQATIKSLKKSERGEFNPGSDTQLRNLLYSVWKLKPIKEKGSVQPKVDESALRRLIPLDKGKHKRFFALQLQFNALDILYNGPLSADIGSDGRIRCAYNIAGTVTGRLSSSAAPDGTGTNLQNQPPFMRRMFLADEGCTMVQCDLKQAENRVVAYLANEPRMIQAFEDGVDIHRRIAAMIFRKAESDISKQERQLGKKIGHASNYGMGVDRFRQVCWEEMRVALTREESKRLQNQYFDAFPRIRMWQLEIQDQLNRTRTLTTPHGRRRYFYERWGPDLFKQAYAFIPQSTIVDTLNLGLINLSETGFDLLLQVHDSVNMNADFEINEGAIAMIKRHMELPLRINNHLVTIPIEVAVGPNWAELKEVVCGK